MVSSNALLEIHVQVYLSRCAFIVPKEEILDISHKFPTNCRYETEGSQFIDGNDVLLMLLYSLKLFDHRWHQTHDSILQDKRVSVYNFASELPWNEFKSQSSKVQGALGRD